MQLLSVWALEAHEEAGFEVERKVQGREFGRFVHGDQPCAIAVEREQLQRPSKQPLGQDSDSANARRHRAKMRLPFARELEDLSLTYYIVAAY